MPEEQVTLSIQKERERGNVMFNVLSRKHTLDVSA